MLRFALTAAALAAGIAAQSLPTGFAVDTLLSDGMTRPTDLCFLPDGRCLVTSMTGEVTIYAAGAYAVIGTMPAIEFGGESGLLSIAADPQFASNGHVYVWYASTLDAALHLDRFTMAGARNAPNSTGLTLDLASRHVVLDALPDASSIHNGGALRFGPDGMLYVTVGDDGDYCGPSSPASGVGCILRLDVSGLPAGPSAVAPSFAQLDPGDNPASAATDITQLVIAYGLRNPFRMEIDEATGNLYVGDVGESYCEELDEYVRGPGSLPLVDFGWSRREGDLPGPGCPPDPTAPYVDPILVEPNANGWRSIIAGPRYRNRPQVAGFGPAYEGHLFVTDYYRGAIRRLVATASGWSIAPPTAGQPSPTEWATGLASLAALRLGPDGNLWFVRNSFFGELGRIRLQAPQNALVVAGGNGQRTSAGDPFAQPIVVRAFDGNGQPLAGATVAFAVQGGGVAQPALAATDAAGFAAANVTATAGGGPIRIDAVQLANGGTASFSLFARKLSATNAAPTLTITIDNATDAVPAQVPFVLLTGFPGVTTLATSIGPLCIDPSHPLAVVLEDGVGAFGGVSLSGGSGVGAPSLAVQYTLPPGLLTGLTMRFQAVGLDPTSGWFRTNCELVAF